MTTPLDDGRPSLIACSPKRRPSRWWVGACWLMVPSACVEPQRQFGTQEETAVSPSASGSNETEGPQTRGTSDESMGVGATLDAVTSEAAPLAPLGGSAPVSEGDATGETATTPPAAEGSSDAASGDATSVYSTGTSPATGAPASSDVEDPCGASLLLNGNFEDGAAHWTASSTYGAFEERVHPLIVSSDHESLEPYGVQAQEGTRLAFLGDVPDDEYMGYRVSLRQPVTLGPGVTGLLLRGYVWVDTEEDPDAEYDYAYVQLEWPDATEEDYFQLQFWTNLDATRGWAPIEAFMPVTSELLERELIFVVEARSDATTPTRFWFDALELLTDCE